MMNAPKVVSCSFPLSFPGTRIIYDRKFLLDRRNSPMAQTPPCHLPNIPGVTSPGTLIEDSKVEVNNLNNHDRKHAVGERHLLSGGCGGRVLDGSGLKNADISNISDISMSVCFPYFTTLSLMKF